MHQYDKQCLLLLQIFLSVHLKVQRTSFRVVYYMASFDELANWPHLLINWPLIFQKVQLLIFYHFLWILTGHSPISCKSFVWGLAWNY